MLVGLLALGFFGATSMVWGAPPASPALPAAQAPAGDSRIYKGTYYRRDSAASAAQLFWYERRSRDEGGLIRSTHTHHTLAGRVVLRQSALHSAKYGLQSFQSDHHQTGVSARAQVLGAGRVRLSRKDGPEQETVVLEHDHPLVVGPTLYGMMLEHWDALVSGRSVVVDYLSIERLDTYAFEIRRVQSDSRTTTFELAPSGLLLSLLVSPLRVVFLSERRQVLRYEGPSPVLLEMNAERQSFDARIEYSETAPVFR